MHTTMRIDVTSELLLTGDFAVTVYNEPLIARSKHKMTASGELVLAALYAAA
jgi:hypothetical protein